jgi:hypothetical protein
MELKFRMMKITIEVDDRIYTAEDPEAEYFWELAELFVSASRSAGYTDVTIKKHVCDLETL